jgi:hypothetical protein
MYGGIPNVLFVCGRWSTVSEQIYSEIEKQQLRVKTKFIDSKFYSPVTYLAAYGSYTRTEIEPLLSLMKNFSFWGIYTPGYENQLVLRPTKNLLKCVGIYYVAKISPSQFDSSLQDKSKMKFVQKIQDKDLLSAESRLNLKRSFYDNAIVKYIENARKRKRQDELQDFERRVKPKLSHS